MSKTKSAYDLAREETIRKNRELLISLGLEKPLGVLVEKRGPGNKAGGTESTERQARKRKKRARDEDDYSGAGEDEEQDDEEVEEEEEQPKPKKKKTKTSVPVDGDDSSAASPGPRRSGRNAGKTVDYKSENVKKDPLSVSAAVQSGIKKSLPGNEGPMGRTGGQRLHNPKTFGHIPGIDVGTWWESREACSADAVHAPWVGGIAGSKDTGAYSIALSGGYEDDVDLGSSFTYTGSGGRDLRGTKAAPKNLRTAPQSSDQSFEDSRNAALKKSCETGKPVRVIRGFKNKSAFAPSEGYRYDGLYRVEKAWMDKGTNSRGFLVCRFAFKRLDGQPALVERSPVADEAQRSSKRRKTAKKEEDDGVKEECDQEPEPSQGKAREGEEQDDADGEDAKDEDGDVEMKEEEPDAEPEEEDAAPKSEGDTTTQDGDDVVPATPSIDNHDDHEEDGPDSLHTQRTKAIEAVYRCADNLNDMARTLNSPEFREAAAADPSVAVEYITAVGGAVAIAAATAVGAVALEAMEDDEASEQEEEEVEARAEELAVEQI